MEPRLEHMRRMLLLASMLRTDPKCVGKCVGLRGSRWGTRTRHARCMQCAPYLRTHCVCTLRTRRVYATCTLAHALLHMHPAHAPCTCTLHMHSCTCTLHMHSCTCRCVAVVTHAASVALVAALACTPTLDAAGKLAPCGLCELSLPSDGGPATVVRRGDDCSTYLPGAAAGATAAWGFADSAEPLESAERMWQEALLLGPTDLAALGPQPDPNDPNDPGAGTRGAVKWVKVDEAYEPESCVQGS